MSEQASVSSRRSAAARANGRKGGFATARNHSAEWLSKRGRSGGETTRDLYSVEFFTHVQSKRLRRRGWPEGKLRKAAEKTAEVVNASGLKTESAQALQAMLGMGA